MQPTHYFEIMVAPDEGMDRSTIAGLASKVLGAAFMAVHILAVDFKKPLPISFPEMKDGDHGTDRFIGTVMRVFGDQDYLQRIRDDHRFKSFEMEFIENARVSKVAEVDYSKVKSYSRYIRYRTDKRSEKAKERLDRRAMRRIGRSNNGMTLEDIEARKNSLPSLDRAMDTHAPRIQMKSHSTGRHFTMCLRRTTHPNPIEGEFSTYNLSKVFDDRGNPIVGGTVPNL